MVISSKASFGVSIRTIHGTVAPGAGTVVPMSVTNFPYSCREVVTLIRRPRVMGLFHSRSPIRRGLKHVLIVGSTTRSLKTHCDDYRHANYRASITVFSLRTIGGIAATRNKTVYLGLPGPFSGARLCGRLQVADLGYRAGSTFSGSGTKK